MALETVRLECRRGKGNSQCSGEMRSCLLYTSGNAAADDVEHRGLAAAVAAHNGHEFAILDGQVEVLEQTHFGDGALIIDLGDVFQLKHGASPCPSARCPAPE